MTEKLTIKLDHGGNGAIELHDIGSVIITKRLWPYNDTTLLLVQDPNGVASQFYTKPNTLIRALTIETPGSVYRFRGVAINRPRTFTRAAQILQIGGAGHWFQFTRRNADYSCVADVHYYEAHEAEEADREGELDDTITGLVNSLSTTTITDTNKDWTGDDWTSPSGKYGLIIKKNPKRPAESVTFNKSVGFGASSGTVDDTYTNDDDFCYVYDEGATPPDIELAFSTSIARADIPTMKVKLIFENLYSGAANGEIQIYNYDTPGWDTLKTISATRTYIGNFDALESGAALDTTKHIDTDGSMKVRFEPAAGTFGMTARYGGRTYFCRIELKYGSYPTLQYGISSHTSDGAPETITADTDLSGIVDLHDYYTIGTRSDYVLKDLLGAHDFQQALTTTNVAAGTKYLVPVWEEEQVSQMINYCITEENWDAWIDDALDVHTQDSSSPSSTGLKFDTTSVNLQLISGRDAAEGEQIHNRVKVQWAGGIEQADDEASQAIYGILEPPVYVHREIESREEAAALATHYLKDVGTTLAIRSFIGYTLYVGKSLVVNVPERNISSQTYLIRELRYVYDVEQAFSHLDVTLAKAGSPTHRDENTLEQIHRLQYQLKQTRRLIPTTIPERTSGTSIQKHADTHHPGETDELLLDEDNFATDSATKGASQQSIKKYVDDQDHDHATPIATHAGDDDAHHAVFESLVDDTTPQLGGDLDLNGNRTFSSSGYWLLKLSGDNDDYLKWYTVAGTPYIEIISGDRWRWKSDHATVVAIEFYHDDTHRCMWYFRKDTPAMWLWCTGDIYVMPDADTDDYLVFSTDSDVPHIKTAGSSNLHVEPDGGTTEFTGTVDLATQSAPFLPRRVSQADQPVPASGEILIWRDTDDDKTYLVYTDPDLGARTVELA